jgi:YHS domain-containing protein
MERSVVMKHIKMACLMLAITFFVTGYVLAEGDAAKSKPQTTCPVMGGKINKEIYTDYEGKRVYFCCKGCIGEFKKDPAKHIKKLEEEGVALEKVPGAGLKNESSSKSDEKNSSCRSCGGCGCDSCL